MVKFDKQSKTYLCEKCFLHYKNRKLATACEEWDKKHNTCNLAIARESIESRRARGEININKLGGGGI